MPGLADAAVLDAWSRNVNPWTTADAIAALIEKADAAGGGDFFVLSFEQIAHARAAASAYRQARFADPDRAAGSVMRRSTALSATA
jgi:hypothetical protein